MNSNPFFTSKILILNAYQLATFQLDFCRWRERIDSVTFGHHIHKIISSFFMFLLSGHVKWTCRLPVQIKSSSSRRVFSRQHFWNGIIIICFSFLAYRASKKEGRASKRTSQMYKSSIHCLSKMCVGEDIFSVTVYFSSETPCIISRTGNFMWKNPGRS